MFKSNLIYLLVLLVFIPSRLFSQYKIIDQNTTVAVPYAHIFLDNKFYTYSNENGEFTIAAKQKFDTLKVAHLSYETKLIGYKDVQNTTTISVKEKINTLDEVAITVKRKTRKTKILLPERANRDFFSKDYDIALLFEMGTTSGKDEYSENVISRAVYVPNENQKVDARINKIILNSVDKEIDGDFNYIPFRVNLMTYDTITKLPKEKIFAEDLLAGKKKGQKVVIDLSKEGFTEFPKEGICVVVMVYHTAYYVNNGINNLPKFNTVSLRKNSGFHEYCFGMDEDEVWKEQFYSQTREQCFDFGIEVEFTE